MTRKAKNPVSTSEKTLRILTSLKEIDGGSVTELADRLDMSKGTVHSHLATLHEHGFIVKRNGTYDLSLKLLDLGGYARDRMGLLKKAEPEVNKLAEETDELANLMTEQHGMGVYLHRAKGSQAIDLNTYIGLRVHLHWTALGLAILANVSDDRVDEIIDDNGLPSQTRKTVTSRNALDQRLERVRDRGYAVDDEELLAGLRCVAAPILSSRDDVLGAVSISAPKSRMQGQRFEEEIPNLVSRAANVIELNMNYS